MKNQHIGTVATHLVFNAIACYLIAKKCDGFSKAGAVGMLAASAIQCTRKADESLNQKVFYSAASFVILAISFSKLDKKVNFCATLLLGGSHLLIHEFIYKPLEYQDDPSYPQVKAALQTRPASLKVKRLLEQATLQKAGGRHAAAARTLSYALSAAASCLTQEIRTSEFLKLAFWYLEQDDIDSAEAMLTRSYHPYVVPTKNTRTNEMDRLLEALALKLPTKEEQLERLLELCSVTKSTKFTKYARTIAPNCENPEQALRSIWNKEIRLSLSFPEGSFVVLLAIVKEQKDSYPRLALQTLKVIDQDRSLKVLSKQQAAEVAQEKIEVCSQLPLEEQFEELLTFVKNATPMQQPRLLNHLRKIVLNDEDHQAKFQQLWEWRIQSIQGDLYPLLMNNKLMALAQELADTHPKLAIQTLNHMDSVVGAFLEIQIATLKKTLLPKIISEFLNSDKIEEETLKETATLMKGHKTPHMVYQQVYNAATRIANQDQRLTICLALRAAFIGLDRTFADKLAQSTQGNLAGAAHSIPNVAFPSIPGNKPG